MSDQLIQGTQIKDLPITTTISDTDDFIIEDATPKTKHVKWSTILTAIKEKVSSWTFSNLTTTSKTLPGAVNELNGSLKVVSGTTHNIFDLRKGKKNTGSIVKNANDSSDFGTYLEDVNLTTGNRTRLLLAGGEVKIQYLSPTQAVIKEVMLGDLTK